MHIPPAYYKKEMKRFLAGAVLGGCFAYIIFIYIYGEMYEQAIEDSITARTEVQEWEEKYEQLLSEQESRPNIEYVEDMTIKLTNVKQLSIDKLTQHELIQETKSLLKPVQGTEISKLTGHEELIVTTVENKDFRIDDFTYHLTVTKLIISRTLIIEVEIKAENG
ncbi:sporulation membrane protein YtrI [Salimicrobium halophilum]|uniref:Sporulation membrane protein YtrI C-terminal domain-containing protein n=1 Tax=Salimicrobium halophilum TaxID=86666 RepID=A0A1G8VIH7_9BACI|nr:sporulation membrane protein YtrI [Salimicrobium halophilum]SDJ65707.1 hypothetical protein SAMN04490247_2716 [Salimicrobium halophilum]